LIIIYDNGDYDQHCSVVSFFKVIGYCTSSNWIKIQMCKKRNKDGVLRNTFSKLHGKPGGHSQIKKNLVYYLYVYQSLLGVGDLQYMLKQGRLNSAVVGRDKDC
jgi:hypothetical protein